MANIFVWFAAGLAALLTIVVIALFAVAPLLLAIIFDTDYFAIPLPLTGLISYVAWVKLFRWVAKKEAKRNEHING